MQRKEVYIVLIQTQCNTSFVFANQQITVDCHFRDYSRICTEEPGGGCGGTFEIHSSLFLACFLLIMKSGFRN